MKNTPPTHSPTETVSDYKNKEKSMDTQQIVSFEPSLWFKVKRYFSLPRFYFSLLENKDKSKAIFMRGFYKNEFTFAIDRFELEEKENLQTYWSESVGILDLITYFFKKSK